MCLLLYHRCSMASSSNRYLAALLGCIWLWSACGDPVERSIDVIIAGGDGLEKARLELNMAKVSAIAPLVRAVEDQDLPVRARLDFVDALLPTPPARGGPCHPADDSASHAGSRTAGAGGGGAGRR